jgi:hypothetical protein
MFNSFLSPIGSYTQGLQLGDTYEGGTIVYLLQPGDPGYDANQQHGLIFGEFIYNTFNSNYLWKWAGPEPQLNVTTSTAIGAGAANTNAIVAAYGTVNKNAAAIQCYDSTYNGYTDWFLPSLNELKAMIPFAKTLSSWTAQIGNTWTSTQFNLNDAYEIYNNQTNEGTTNKLSELRVALTRSF